MRGLEAATIERTSRASRAPLADCQSCLLVTLCLPIGRVGAMFAVYCRQAREWCQMQIGTKLTLEVGTKFTWRGVECEFLGVAGRETIRIRMTGSDEVTLVRMSRLIKEQRNIRYPCRSKKKDRKRRALPQTTLLHAVVDWQMVGMSLMRITPPYVTMCNRTTLSYPERFEAPTFGNAHALTPDSERQYEGGSPEEALIAACERMLSPHELSGAGIHQSSRRDDMICFCEINDGALTPWNHVSSQEEPNDDRRRRPQPSSRGASSQRQTEGDATSQVEPCRESTTPPSPTAEQRESWQMTLAEWKRIRDELRERGEEQALRAIGGLGSDAAHRVRLEKAFEQGKPVLKEALYDYPELAERYALMQKQQASMRKLLSQIAPAPVQSRSVSGVDERSEPWQMTVADWRAACLRLHERWDATKDPATWQEIIRLGGANVRSGSGAHKVRVRQAMEEGIPVSEAVLKDYPDLLASDR